ncbi:MAG: aminotransferase class III-fold pyridoxal phosphate-dependent enzyme, partial [Eubacteriales bacterium]|nr:aminotransferase class III-fold pyridoxal phosphate-dependent enzyme [Eubacteriales bacterium]
AAVKLEDEFLRGLRKLCDENGIVLIFDEVITGFRVGMGGYQGLSGIIPDIATMGKAIANGFPVAIVTGKDEIMNRFNTNPAGDVSFQGTYNAHPVCLAAGIATMDILEKEPVHSYIFELGDYFRKGMQEIFDRLKIEATMIGFGSISAPIFASGKFRNQEEIMRGDAAKSVAFRRAMIETGHYFAPAEPKRLVVSYSHTKADIDETLQAAETVLRKL